MKLVRYISDTGARLGLLAGTGDEVVPLGVANLTQLLAQPDPRRFLYEALGDGDSVPLAEDKLLAPHVPGKMLFCGVNYRSHLEENPSATLPSEPFFFSKLPSAVTGPGQPIVMPYPGCSVDYEVELAVVIGTRARNVDEEHALDHVFGYTLVNDVSARDIQFRDSQITLGKNPDTFCPLGPTILLASAMPDLAEVQITTRVNDELRQSGCAADMLFGIPELIARLSALMTLEPGDLVTTGTPAGVAAFRNPPLWLAPGDEVTVAADQIGRLTNKVVARRAA